MGSSTAYKDNRILNVTFANPSYLLRNLWFQLEDLEGKTRSVSPSCCLRWLGLQLFSLPLQPPQDLPHQRTIMTAHATFQQETSPRITSLAIQMLPSALVAPSNLSVSQMASAS